MAILMLPFLTLLLGTIQTGVYFMSQSALDSGVLRTAETLRGNMMAGASFSAPSASSIKSSITADGGGLLGGMTPSVDVRQLPNLAGASVPIADGTLDFGGSGSILVLRASSPVFGFVTGMATMTVTSIAVVRRPVY